MIRALVVLLIGVAELAYAAPRQVLVLRAEGNADSATRTSIDAHVLRLAKAMDGKVEAGDITLSEAAAVVGCNFGDAACKDEVLTTLGADEVVGTTVTTTPTGLNVTVRRYAKGTAARGAQTTIASGKPVDAKLNADIGPLFGASAAVAPVTENPPPAAPAKANEPPPPTTPTTATPPRTADTSTEPMTNNAAATTPVTTPPPPEGSNHNRVPKIGMGVGAGFMLLGIIMWTQASDMQSQINNAPASSPTDFKHIKDLEGQGDSFAGAGNLFFVVGLVVGGVSGYYYWRGRRSATAKTARITPTVFPHGAGVTLTFGGAP